MGTPIHVILEPETVEKVAILLREKHEDYYIFYELLYHTGCSGTQLLKMSVSDMTKFCDKYTEFIPQNLRAIINNRIYLQKGKDFFFSSQRTDNLPLSKRTIENVIKRTGEDVGVDNLGVRSINRTFLYEYLRNHDYDFSKLTELLTERNRYISDLSTFVAYCGLTKAEFEADVRRHTGGIRTELLDNCETVMVEILAIQKKLRSENLRSEDLSTIKNKLSQVIAILN